VSIVGHNGAMALEDDKGSTTILYVLNQLSGFLTFLGKAAEWVGPKCMMVSRNDQCRLSKPSLFV